MRNRERVVELYRSGKTIAEVARRVGIARRTVIGHLDREGIRETQDAGREVRQKSVLGEMTRDELVSLYEGPEKPSTAQLGRRYGVSGQTAAKWLRRAGIEPRSYSEQQALHRPEKPPKPEPPSPEESFWGRVEKHDGGCWEWRGKKSHHGYGAVQWEGRTAAAHRVAYVLLRGEIPEGLVLHHLCENTSCVNPNHLEPLTVREHLQRGRTFQAKNAAKTHCPQGHEYTSENTKVKRGQHGGRECRQCHRDQKKRLKKLSKGEQQSLMTYEQQR